MVISSGNHLLHSTIAEIDAAFWNDIVATNLTGALWGCKAAAAALQSGGAIINVSSLAGKRGSAQNSAYCATKFGMNGITQALAKELGPRGIRVNAVCPVYVVTPGLVEALDDARSPKGATPLDRFLADFAEGQKVSVCIRPENVTLSLTRASSSARNSFTGEVTRAIAMGPLTRVEIDCSFPLVALITKKSAEEMSLTKGKNVYATFKATAVHVIRRN